MCPKAGDVVWLQFDPHDGEEGAGHEQAGHRPALVLSPARYNAARAMMICCPMTSRIKGYVFEVVPPGTRASSRPWTGAQGAPPAKAPCRRKCWPTSKPRSKRCCGCEFGRG